MIAQPLYQPLYRPQAFSLEKNDDIDINELSLYLDFALDKTLTARKGPTPTFTRGSGATQVNASGLIEYAPENLILRSEEFDHSGWTKLRASVDGDATTSPTGTLTADKLIEDSSTGSHMTYRITALTSLVPHTFSVYAKADGRNFMYLQCGDGFPVNCHAYFDLSAGTKGTVGANATANIEPAGNGWYRCSVTATPISLTTNAFYINPTAVNGSTTYTGDGTSGLYLWGAQVERASTARTYYPTTTAAFYGPRFDHDPVTLACKGLLIEAERTNALQHSANFKNTTSSNYWENLSTTTVTVDQIASPDGGVNADLLATSTTSFDCFTRRAGIFAGSTQYTYSIFLKQGPSGHRYVGLYIGAGISALKFPFFDFNNPTTVQIPSGTMVGTINSTRVDAYPNGWYRVSVTFTTAATPVTTFCGVYISQSDGTIPASSAAGLDVYIWGIQAELGSFPTSYIPTTGTALQRSADVCSISGGDFTSFYNQSEWTLYADVSGLMSETLVGNRPFVGISDGTYGNFFSIFKASAIGTLQAEALTSSALQFRLGNAYTPYTRYKIALGAKTNDANAAYDGVLKTTDTIVTMPSTMNRLEFRDPTGAAGGAPSCHIARIQYFRKRLPNAKLQSLTTP